MRHTRLNGQQLLSNLLGKYSQYVFAVIKTEHCSCLWIVLSCSLRSSKYATWLVAHNSLYPELSLLESLKIEKKYYWLYLYFK